MLTPGALRALPAARAQAQLNATDLAPFVDPLPRLRVAQPVSRRPDPTQPDHMLAHYRLEMREALIRLHRDLPPTRVWGFEGAFPGPTLETRAGEGISVEWVNSLPQRHFLPIDHTLEGAGASLPEVRTVVHLHGGRTPADSDGYPENWFITGQRALCHYPNGQEATMLWYHDHAMGINRLNIYAGLMGAYFVRDEAEEALHLPAGEQEVALIVCDRQLYKDGQLHYPISDRPGRPWTPEVFGDAMLVNGKLSPYLEVAPRLYRFRILNGSNARFYDFTLSNGHPFTLIGLDQGLMAAPATLRRITLAPAERLDVLIDFSGLAGSRIELRSEFLRILQFRVGAAPAPRAAAPAALRPVERLHPASATVTRQLAIYEYLDERGNSVMMLLNATRWAAPVTETPTLGSTEIWSLVNLTDDSHPIHLHLVRFQVLDRRAFDDFEFLNSGKLRWLADAVPPGADEAGWKDTARADPKMVTRIIVRFDGYSGRYVWHCHILEHEDNEMMRPYEVRPRAEAGKAGA